jgi:hypothetical protein
MMKIILIILHFSLFYSQVRSDCYLDTFKTDCGGPISKTTLAVGETVAFSCPLSLFIPSEERRNLRTGNLNEALPEYMIDLLGLRRRIAGTDGEWYDVGQWSGTCTGLGDKDPAGGQLCQLWYAMEVEDAIKEYLSGTMMFRGEDVTPVTINGGTGYVLLSYNGGFNMTYDGGVYTHEGVLCAPV